MVLLLVVTSSLLAVAAADVSYSSGPPHGSSFSHGGGSFGHFGGGSSFGGEGGGGGFSFGGGGGGFSFGGGGGGFSFGSGGGGGGCGGGQVRHVDGSCVTPQVTRNLYVYRAPDVAPIVGPRPNVPPPQIEHNIVFIHTPEDLTDQQPVVVPPPQQKNVVYLLNKRPEVDQQVIHVPAPEQEAPEIFFVNYADGENPTLPTGEDLQSALRKASHGSGEVVDGGGSIGDIYTGPSPAIDVPSTGYGEY